MLYFRPDLAGPGLWAQWGSRLCPRLYPGFPHELSNIFLIYPRNHCPLQKVCPRDVSKSNSKSMFRGMSDSITVTSTIYTVFLLYLLCVSYIICYIQYMYCMCTSLCVMPLYLVACLVKYIWPIMYYVHLLPRDNYVGGVYWLETGDPELDLDYLCFFFTGSLFLGWDVLNQLPATLCVHFPLCKMWSHIASLLPRVWCRKMCKYGQSWLL